MSQSNLFRVSRRCGRLGTFDAFGPEDVFVYRRVSITQGLVPVSEDSVPFIRKHY